ncbi:TIGR04104 family putative zinc finger protein [Rossellomorea sp. FM04394]|uniref:TIGR04104 family putative zinc finger protein n=1 Tax=Rossellomorea sp. FM04394 TaxID=3243076 RepID=UPI0035A66629
MGHWGWRKKQKRNKVFKKGINRFILSRCINLQKCDRCQTSFSWRAILKSFIWTYKPIHCTNCGTKHEITIRGRLSFVLCTILPAILFFNFLAPFENFVLTIGIGMLILLVGTLLTPFVVTYKGVR